jgi:hypothetical protein
MVNFLSKTSQTTFEDIRKAYYRDRKVITPSLSDLSIIENDVDNMHKVSQSLLLGSLAGFGISYIIWDLPYLGPLLSLVSGVTNVAIAVISFDIYTASNNLRCYSESCNSVNSSLFYMFKNQNSVPLEQVESEIRKAAIVKTFLISKIYDRVFTSQK